MSQTTLPPDSERPIDDVLSDFFKSKLPQPWPAAPRTAEPASLLASRRATAQNNRARLTLAASVAILLGTCWYFSNAPQPAERSKPAPGNSGVLDKGSATMPKEFEKPKEPMLN